MENIFKNLVGKTVLYVLPAGPSKGEIRPAIVVKQWQPDAGTIQLQVFTDSGRGIEANDSLPPVMWATSVSYDENPKSPQLGTWHFMKD